MQQIIPFRQSTVDIHFRENEVVITTKNVARLCLREPAVSPVIWNQRRVHIDDTSLTIDEFQGKLAAGYIIFRLMSKFRSMVVSVYFLK